MTRSTVRRTTIREVLDLAIELERKTMGLYVEFVGLFAADAELRQFWFNMARHEAAHCGALMLVESFFESDPDLAAEAHVLFDTSTGVRLGSLLTGYRREARRGVGPERALEMALDLEGSELEDVVIELLQVVKDPGWRDQAVKMMIHDLGELSYMIEKHTRDAKLLKRADALMERRRSRPASAPIPIRQGRTRSSPARGAR
jgi:rubrerythrin